MSSCDGILLLTVSPAAARTLSDEWAHGSQVNTTTDRGDGPAVQPGSHGLVN